MQFTSFFSRNDRELSSELPVCEVQCFAAVRDGAFPPRSQARERGRWERLKYCPARFQTEIKAEIKPPLP